MEQLNPGDRVIRVDGNFGGVKQNKEYIVTRHSGPDLYVEGDNYAYARRGFKLVEEGNTNTMNDTNAKIIRLLSTVAVISSAMFAKQNATKQTEILALASGKSVLFVDNFTKLSDTKRLAERLLAGEDVTMELEFNNITLSDDERNAINAVRPVLEKLNALKGSGYDWLPDIELDAAKTRLRFVNAAVVSRNGYEVSKAQAKRVWEKAAPWYMGGDKPTDMTGRFDSYQRTLSFHDDDMTLSIGCQNNITRAEVEAIARHFKFEAPNA